MGNIDRRKNFIKMELATWLFLLIAVVTLATPAQSASPRVVCYYTNWSVYRPGTAKFNPQNINPYLCTHLVYAFGGFTKDNTLKPFDKYQDIEKGGYAKFNGLKTYNKNLKTLLAIGGWNEGSSRFSPMVAAKDRRREFARNAIKFLRQNQFDGLDLDWEYPASREGGKPKDRENYVKFVKELRQEFEKESEKTGKPRLLLTMAVPAGIEYIEKGFDIKTLTRYLDWMNLLTYDYHSAFEPAVNHHAPLYPLEEPNEYSVDNELNIDYTIKFYLENGADPEKLVLGIPTYGRSYTLFNADAVEIGSPADGPGEQGVATREKGYLAYYEICEAQISKTKKRAIASDEDSEEESEEEDEEEEEEKWTIMYPNPNAMGPVAFKGNQWVGYDDVEIVKKKAHYVVENGLGGIMFWSIDNDDFRGVCNGKPYPLIEAAKEAYLTKLESSKNSVSSPKESSKPSRGGNRRRNRPKTTPTTTTTTTTTTPKPPKSNKRKSTSSVSTTPTWNIITPEPPTTPDPGSDFKCTDEGFFPHPRDCKKYFWCLDSGPSDLGIVAHAFTCPSGLYFNKAADSCDFARNVLCKKSSSTTKAVTKTTTTKTTPTTTTTTTTTTRRPIRLTSRSSLLFRTSTTTTTTTPEPELSEEDEEEADDASDVEAEDPKVIKELIDLIKKVGGVEQLEKQLKLSESSGSTDGVATTTPTSFNTKLYQKVLERARGKNKFVGNSITESSVQNSRRGPQNEGLEPAVDKDRLLRRERPQYVTINRARSSTTPESLESEEAEDESEEIQETVQEQRSEVPAARVATTPKPLQYVNIRRTRPTTAATETPDDSRNALFERESSESEERLTAVEDAQRVDRGDSRRDTPEYVTIRRGRPTTEATTLPYHSAEEEDKSQEVALVKEITSQSSLPQYNSIVRFRSTTQSPAEELTNPAPTTVLSVQISSLLNSPSSDETASPRTDSTTAHVTEASEPEVTTASTTVVTTTTTPITTTTTTTPLPPSTTTRRNLLRRRGSTTPTTPTTAAAVSTTQAAKERRTFPRRTKATAPPETTGEVTNSQTTTSKYPRRGENKFKIQKTEKVEKSRESNSTESQPSLNGTAASNDRPNRNFVRRRFGGANTSTTQSSTIQLSSSVTRRPFRVANRRRLFSTTTTTTTTSPSTTELESDESLQDIGDTDAIEDPSLQPQPRARKVSNGPRRRPLVQLKNENEDQNSSATNEDEKTRQSKKYSASFKQNQLEEILKIRASAEEIDVTTEGRSTLDDTSAETAVALAAHQLLSAPIPIIPDYDDESKPARSSQTIVDYKFTSPEYNDLTKTQTYTEDYQRTPSYTSTGQRFESTTPYTLRTEGNVRSTTGSVNSETNIPSGFTTPGAFTGRFTSPTTGNTINPTFSGITLSLGSEGSGESTARYTSNFPKESTPTTYTISNYETRTLRPGLSTNIVNPTSLNLRESTARIYASLDRSVQPTYSTEFTTKISRPAGFSPNSVKIDEIENDKTTEKYTGFIERGPSTARYEGSSEKISVPVAVGYSSGSQGLQEPSYFTREYLLESPVTRTYDDEYQYLSPATTPQPTTKKPLRRKTIYRRISSTAAPSSQITQSLSSIRTSPTTLTTPTQPITQTTVKPRRTSRKPFQRIAVKKGPLQKQPVQPEIKDSVPKEVQKTLVLKINNNAVKSSRPLSDYDYYDDSHEGVKYEDGSKVLLHGKGDIECLDIGNFAHPSSCKKFISCARMESGALVGWEYICPKGLSFDPVGGICNWSAGLGCTEKDA
ncbi:mucin-2 [Danaus plexippus]|uniref:mucin-2 n=1 Tax=Danaus plexippus TaxID=13037 RepID=UPI002AAFAD42|nr:mucin-2 [Danaus plexippus]